MPKKKESRFSENGPLFQSLFETNLDQIRKSKPAQSGCTSKADLGLARRIAQSELRRQEAAERQAQLPKPPKSTQASTGAPNPPGTKSLRKARRREALEAEQKRRIAESEAKIDAIAQQQLCQKSNRDPIEPAKAPQPVSQNPNKVPIGTAQAPQQVSQNPNKVPLGTPQAPSRKRRLTNSQYTAPSKAEKGLQDQTVSTQQTAQRVAPQQNKAAKAQPQAIKWINPAHPPNKKSLGKAQRAAYLKAPKQTKDQTAQSENIKHRFEAQQINAEQEQPQVTEWVGQLLFDKVNQELQGFGAKSAQQPVESSATHLNSPEVIQEDILDQETSVTDLNSMNPNGWPQQPVFNTHFFPNNPDSSASTGQYAQQRGLPSNANPAHFSGQGLQQSRWANSNASTQWAQGHYTSGQHPQQAFSSASTAPTIDYAQRERTNMNPVPSYQGLGHGLWPLPSHPPFTYFSGIDLAPNYSGNVAGHWGPNQSMMPEWNNPVLTPNQTASLPPNPVQQAQFHSVPFQPQSRSNASVAQVRGRVTAGHTSMPSMHHDPAPTPARAYSSVSLPKPEPAKAYLSQSAKHTRRLPRPKPLLIISDLNGTLILRKKVGTTTFTRRPSLSSFLEYLFANHTVMFWTSMRTVNMQAVLDSALTKTQRDQCAAMWGREMLGLSLTDLNRKVQVYKRLGEVWKNEEIQKKHPDYAKGGRWNQRNTVLIDDSVEKARGQPWNLVNIPELNADELVELRKEDGEIIKMKEAQVAVLSQVWKYLEQCRWQEDVSAFIKADPFKIEVNIRETIKPKAVDGSSENSGTPQAGSGSAKTHRRRRKQIEARRGWREATVEPELKIDEPGAGKGNV